MIRPDVGTFNYVTDAREIDQMLRGANGIAARFAIELGEVVKRLAKDKVGKDTHTLEESIVKRFIPGANGPEVWVGSEVEYTWDHHEGTPPHVIEPINGEALMFTINGEVIFARKVNHPGTRPNPFLTDAMRDAQRAVL